MSADSRPIVAKRIKTSSVQQPRPPTSSSSSSLNNSHKPAIRVLHSNSTGQKQLSSAQTGPDNHNELPSNGSSPSPCFAEPVCVCGAAQLNVNHYALQQQQQRNIVRASPQELYQQRRWISAERLNELRKRTQEAIRNHKVFTIRGCFYTVRKALLQRGFVERLDGHRRAAVPCNLTMDEMLHQLPHRLAGESKRQYIQKCERNIVSRFLEHTPVDFLWTFRKVREYLSRVCGKGRELWKRFFLPGDVIVNHQAAPLMVY